LLLGKQIERMMDSGQPRQNVGMTTFNQKQDMVVTMGGINRRITIQIIHGINVKLY
jgi:N-acetylneuraminic acid mutarotase